ncbi:PspC domain-containing protein [Nocardia paucivorans]|uniref:PspC domain-containing protein n=1 Tax=Nocardia paucivorans TaxID=114259 RepID=UPI0002DB986E|nr:PspC domain-containing protein [Nocardia paucivorans]
MTAPARRFARSTTDKWIGGVCGGIAEYFGWSSTIVRLLFVLSCLLPGPQFVIYLALWLLMPKQR